MSKTHWKSTTNPNYLGAYSLPDGKDIVVVIDYVKKETVVGVNGKKEEETVAHLKNGVKPFILNKTNMKTITKVCGSPYIEDWTGIAIQIYFDPTVKFGKETLGGLRVRPFKPETPAKNEKPKTNENIVCADCGNVIKEAYGKTADWVSKYTFQQYGRCLCDACATKAASAKEV